MEEKELNIKLSVSETNIILAAMSEQSYKSVAGVIGKIQTQAQAQLQAAVSKNATGSEV